MKHITRRRMRHPLFWAGDRRSDRRYEIAAELEYRVISGERVVQTGNGRTVNFSRTGILFEAEQPLPVGTEVEVSVAWPVRLDNAVAINLYISGQVARSISGHNAIRILDHEFRIRGRQRTAAGCFRGRALVAAAASQSEPAPLCQ